MLLAHSHRPGPVRHLQLASAPPFFFRIGNLTRGATAGAPAAPGPGPPGRGASRVSFPRAAAGDSGLPVGAVKRASDSDSVGVPPRPARVSKPRSWVPALASRRGRRPRGAAASESCWALLAWPRRLRLGLPESRAHRRTGSCESTTSSAKGRLGTTRHQQPVEVGVQSSPSPSKVTG